MTGNNIAIWRVAAHDEHIPEKPPEVIVIDPVPTSMDEATRHLPQGGYTTFRTYDHRRVLRFADHIQRLETAARLAGKPIILNEDQIRQDLRKILQHAALGNLRMRIILDLEREPRTIIYLAEPLRVPSTYDYEHGVKTVTREMQRSNPKAKLTNFIERASTVREQLPPGTNEALMVSVNGVLLEGLSSNFFAIRDSTIWTAGDGVLPGITRAIVLDTIYELGITLRLEPFRIDEIDTMDEALITSASRAVLPIHSINGQPVGSGNPGPLTKRIFARYQRRIEEELEPI